MEEVKKIIYNLDLINWFYDVEENIDLHEEEYNQQLFQFLSITINEDPHVFFRIFMYFANTRNTATQEMKYKILIHFLCVLVPNQVLSNIDLLIDAGKKTDVLYYLINPTVQKRMHVWINHKEKMDKDYTLLKEGKKIDTVKNIKYFNTNYKKLLIDILDDTDFNGIML